MMTIKNITKYLFIIINFTFCAEINGIITAANISRLNVTKGYHEQLEKKDYGIFVIYFDDSWKKVKEAEYFYYKIEMLTYRIESVLFPYRRMSYNPHCDYYDTESYFFFCDRFKFYPGIKYSFPVEVGNKKLLWFRSYRADENILRIFPLLRPFDYREGKDKAIENFEVKKGRIYEFTFTFDESFINAKPYRLRNNVFTLKVDLYSLNGFKNKNQNKVVGIIEKINKGETLYFEKNNEITTEEKEMMKNYERSANPTEKHKVHSLFYFPKDEK